KGNGRRCPWIRRHHLTAAAMLTSDSDSVAQPSPLDPGAGRAERLKFADFNFQCAASGVCKAEVTLEAHDGAHISGSAKGQSSPLGDLRISAEAAMKAIEESSSGELKLELIGIKSVRAFDANVIIVSL